MGLVEASTRDCTTFTIPKMAAVSSAGEHKYAHVLENALVIAMPVAYLVQGVAIFDVLPMYIPLFTFLAFANYYFNRNHESRV